MTTAATGVEDVRTVPEEERLPRAATIAAGQRPRMVREPEPPFPGAQQLPF